jgi:hypothetical protein
MHEELFMITVYSPHAPGRQELVRDWTGVSVAFLQSSPSFITPPMRAPMHSLPLVSRDYEKYNAYQEKRSP